MTPEQFCYWLQGYFEVGHRYGIGLSGEEAKLIRDHLAIVFNREVVSQRKHIPLVDIVYGLNKDKKIEITPEIENELELRKRGTGTGKESEILKMPAGTYWNPILQRWECNTPVSLVENPFEVCYTGPPYSC